MRFAFIVDPLDSLRFYKDTSVAMMRAAAARGHEIWALPVDALSWSSRLGVCATATHIHPFPKDGKAGVEKSLDNTAPWYERIGEESLPLAKFDAVLMRKDPPFDIEYVAATWLLERAEAEGARVFNSPAALRDHSEKFALAEFAEFSVPTLVARSAAHLNEFIDTEGDTVLKPLDGMGGRGIFRVRRDDPNRNAIIETLTEFGQRTVMAQRFIPEISEGDKRILLIDGEIVPWCLARIPKAGETRGNLAAGGTGEVRELSAADRRIAARVAPVLAARGLLLVGLDVIGSYLTEINVTSPTCMVEIRAGAGYDVPAQFIAALERKCGVTQ
ncbi:MAG: glutathione synthase [Betaproteobacteria bacterium]|nr:glutathione synthase [Betaproteobacteria bacterium]